MHACIYVCCPYLAVLSCTINNVTRYYFIHFLDRYVMLGNHRDSWVLGAIDPSSGTATMMELSRVLGQLVKDSEYIFCSYTYSYWRYYLPFRNNVFQVAFYVIFLLLLLLLLLQGRGGVDCHVQTSIQTIKSYCCCWC